ncbi:C40 family peptidase [Streptomyces sp. B1866]|uniref:C40 family peptidase n=1 Tax=Streptomyces sp. B1866 TaxID=3075431 RepID=UPI00288FF2A7|nr:C40 family peptidase [Streptomyces sp. B1866]MDT3400584.1 C40 family peptidase [Streptomyces sp. B1866]
MAGRITRSACAAALAAAAVLAAPAPGGYAAPAAPAAAPGAEPVADLLVRLRTLYRQAEEATEAYNATGERLRAQRARVAKLDRALRRARARLAGSRARAGALARRQYQGHSELSRYSALLTLLRPGPPPPLDERRELRRAARRQAAAVDRLTRAEDRAHRLAARARKALRERERLTARRATQRRTVQRRLRAIERTLASLSDSRLAKLRRLERQGAAGAHRERLASDRALRSAVAEDRAPTSAGGRALRYAVEQIGKPYGWGQEGPDAFDCSGLTSQAWAHAGRPIPRTSQEQWRKLPKVPMDELRPGDLVVYFPGATHVALYAGGGQVVQAPRPGARVTMSPMAVNPVLGAVRPDAEPQTRDPRVRPARRA